MATLVAQLPGGPNGNTFTPAAATGGGDNFANTGLEFFYINNAGVGSINVTFTAQGACSFGVTNAAHNSVVAVPNGTSKIIGPFPVGRFNDANNLCQITYSGTTSVTVAVLRTS